MILARIIKIVSNQYTIQLTDGQEKLALAMGKVRLDKSPLVGDMVEVEEIDDKWVIQSIHPRRNELRRPAIANVDQAFIMMSTKDPEFSMILVDRLIFLISLERIEPIIVVTKMDLIDNDQELKEILNDYRKSGYLVIEIGYDQSLSDFLPIFKDKITVLTGNSGVGKSTLLNRIDPSLQIKTQETSKKLGRGKHTTTHTELHSIYGGLIADTPGFSTLDFSSVDAFELSRSIRDFQIEKECRFRDCMHQSEPGCAIKEAVEAGEVSEIRYKNYLQVLPLTNKEVY